MIYSWISASSSSSSSSSFSCDDDGGGGGDGENCFSGKFIWRKTGDIVALKKVRMDNEREGVCLSTSFEQRLYNCSQDCFLSDLVCIRCIIDVMHY